MAKITKQTKSSYTTIDNDAIRDMNLTNKDLGILIRLLALPDSWNFSIMGLIKGNKVPGSKNSIAEGIKRLEQLGYMQRVQNRNNGQFGSNDWIVTDSLYIPSGDKLSPCPKKRDAGKRDTEKWDPVFRAQVNKDNTIIDLQKKDNVLSPEDYAALITKYGHTLVDDMINYIIKKNYKNCMNVPTISKWIDERLNRPRPQHKNNRFEYEHNYDFEALEKEILAN